MFSQITISGEIQEVQTQDKNQTLTVKSGYISYPFVVEVYSDQEFSVGDPVLVIGTPHNQGNALSVTNALVTVATTERHFHNVVLFGYLGRDIVLRYTQAGQTVASSSLGVNHFKDDKPNWYSFSAWDKKAETISNYLRKGSLLGISGTVKTNEENYLQVTVQELSLLPKKYQPKTETGQTAVLTDDYADVF